MNMKENLKKLVVENTHKRNLWMFVSGENRDGVDSCGDKMPSYVHTNDVHVFVSLGETRDLPEFTEEDNKEVLQEIRTNITDSALVSYLWPTQGQESENDFSSELRDQIGILGSPEIEEPYHRSYRLNEKLSEGFTLDEDDNPCFHYAVKATFRLKAKPF